MIMIGCNFPRDWNFIKAIHTQYMKRFNLFKIYFSIKFQIFMLKSQNNNGIKYYIRIT